MLNDKTLFLVFSGGMLLGAALGIAGAVSGTTKLIQRQAVSEGAAYYDIESSEFKWRKCNGQ